MLLLVLGGLSWLILRDDSGKSIQQPPTNNDSGAVIPVPGNVVELDFPKAGSLVKSPLTITGRAKGFWFFEASFPVKIVDANDNTLGQHYAQAQGEWMTVEFVPFVSLLSFKESPTATGFLVLQRDNPSGLPEYDQEVRFPVRFR